MDYKYRPAFEHLERRDVPSAATPSSVNFTAGVVTVQGSASTDAITISQASGLVTVADSGRVLKQFSATTVKKIVVDGGFGNDTITIRLAVTKPAFVYGGYGNDIIYGGGAGDQLYGGAEADYLFGRHGNDLLFGGTGNDHLDGGLGVNTLVQGTPGRTYQHGATEQAVVNLVNQERTSRGLAPVTVNVTLAHAAWFHSGQMATRSNAMPSTPGNAMQHILYGVNAPTPTSRLDYAGYDDWWTYGENVAFGYTTAQSVMQGWMNSQGHRDNILNPNFSEIGVGVATNAAGYLYWTQMFGTR